MQKRNARVYMEDSKSAKARRFMTTLAITNSGGSWYGGTMGPTCEVCWCMETYGKMM